MNKDKVAGKLAAVLLQVQKRFAEFMNNKTQGCSIRKLKVSFFILCTALLSLSIGCIVNAFTKYPAPRSITVTRMRFAPLMKEKKEPVKMVTADEYKRLLLFRKYMDSLHYDSILLSRPGLMDSVSMLEQIYLQQLK